MQQTVQKKTVQKKTAQISAIIEKRRPVVRRIEAVETHLKILSEALYALQAQCSAQIQKVDDADVCDRLSQINTSPLQSSIKAELQTLANLKRRFSRDTLNIGVIGRARQGKSRLLQSLSGLTTDEIPDGDRQHCTGVRSTIRHQPTTDTYGEVCFHSEQSFLSDVIAPYYKALGLGQRPLSLDAFARQPLPKLPKDRSAYAEPGAMYEHLKRYHNCFDQYAGLLGSPPKQISRGEIRAYVAQDTPDGQRIFFNYLAVRDVKITCLFPHEEVGQIALVDMPGLGDTGVGDEARLVQTLGQDVDVVLFVRMPKSSGDYWADVDVRLYDVARKALPMLPLELWSFLVLNRTSADSKNGDNWHNCEDLKESLAEKHIQVVQQMTTNCADDAEAEALLDSILQYMAENITQLDRQYASACQDSLSQLQRAIESELKKAQQAMGQASFQTNWFPMFETLFDELWSGLTTGLESLLKDLSEQRYQPDLDFKQQVDVALNACKEDTGLPTLKEIEIRRDCVKSYAIAYNQYLNEVRAYLSRHFLVVDEALKAGIAKIKAQVVNALVTQGQLGGLTNSRDAEFLDAMVQRMPDQLIPGKPSQVKFGFEILASFDLSYRGLIQHRIRKNLDDLTPDTTKLQLSDSPSASEVLSCLTTLQAEATYKCRTALNDLLDEPSQAAFAIVEEFTDRVLRAEDVKKEWRIFLAEMRSEVWCDQFGQLEERSKAHRHWLEVVENATAANQVKKLSFLD
ncbi:MAG: GTPase domain-containing protein [Phormidesmis sp.]